MSLKYILTNDGNPTIISTNIIPFIPSDDLGNVELKNDLSEYDPLKISKWFKLTGENIKLGEKFSLGKGEKKEITLTISPPKEAFQGDYYLTLLFTTSNEGRINQTGPSSNAKIGTNILLTVNENEDLLYKRAKISEFSALKFIDSFSPIKYILKITNTGNTFFKPVGQIEIKPLFGKTIILKLAPQNILTQSTRKIYCLQGERIIPCETRSKFLMGIYKAKLTFKPDGIGKNIEEETTTFAFPFYLTASIILLIILLRFIILNQKSNSDVNS